MRKKTQEINRMSNGIETVETKRNIYEQKGSQRNDDTDIMIFILALFGMIIIFVIMLFK